MQIIRHWTNSPPASHGASVALGNFDGVHLGHLSVLDLARRPGSPFGVVTFEPHPREFFDPNGQPFRLMNAEARANRLARLGVGYLFELGFDTALAELSAEAFARDVLAQGLHVRHVVVGEDFCYGKGRKGTVRDLAVLGGQFGFDVTVAPLRQMEGQVLSSTAIRAALTTGDMRGAAAMLGHWHRIEGPVLHGEKRGRTLGYPTANMSIAGLHPPRFGVYAVQVDVLSGPHAGRYGGVASIGVRPMFGQNMPNLETFIFDFKGDLYDTHLSVALVSHLRDEARFDSLDALIVQMDLDSAHARAILSAL
ncbi:MAG: bifunctional riboflavin kinase/FAD synthetase [Roseinatronobacter sp.]